MEWVNLIWIALQVFFGYNLLFPSFLYLFWRISKTKPSSRLNEFNADYGIIVTAYEQVHTLPAVVNSLLKLNYSKFIVYVVADKCDDISTLSFDESRVIVLSPPEVLASNTKSHLYAMSHFIRVHDRVVIIDSDNLVDSEYLHQLNYQFDQGFSAVQGIRKAKNLDTVFSCLDAARDIYYHFYDGKILFELNSSATLSGSGMAFDYGLYRDFLALNHVSGAGFDKVLQAWLVKKRYRIAFAENAIVYDEKTSKSDQLVQQRSRWINTWFKYFRLGFGILFMGIRSFNKNQFLFGLVLLRPPLFLFLIFSIFSFLFNILIFNISGSLLWLAGLFIFVSFFLIALGSSTTDKRIYRSLFNIPKFMYYQVLSLLKVRKANEISIATKHYYNEFNDEKN